MSGALISLPHSLLHSFKKSCAWWLENDVSHEKFTPIQSENWKKFCASMGECDDEEGLSFLVEKYLEETIFFEDAFFTGYYEPILKGSMTPSASYPIPLYQLPKNPSFPRREIREGALAGQGLELVYVSDAVDAFFLEIQGSGRVELDDGRVLRVGYAGKNGFAYTPIGRVLKELGALPPDAISMQTIKKWLWDHYHHAHEIMDQNQSYVFFKKILENESEEPGYIGPLGTQKLPLTPMMSVACDAEHWPFGILIHYNFQDPLLSGFALTQDTGGAIKGPLRFDLFCGHGAEAEALAGALKTNACVSAFLPKDRKCD